MDFCCIFFNDQLKQSLIQRFDLAHIGIILEEYIFVSVVMDHNDCNFFCNFGT